MGTWAFWLRSKTPKNSEKHLRYHIQVASCNSWTIMNPLPKIQSVRRRVMCYSPQFATAPASPSAESTHKYFATNRPQWKPFWHLAWWLLDSGWNRWNLCWQCCHVDVHQNPPQWRQTPQRMQQVLLIWPAPTRVQTSGFPETYLGAKEEKCWKGSMHHETTVVLTHLARNPWR